MCLLIPRNPSQSPIEHMPHVNPMLLFKLYIFDTIVIEDMGVCIVWVENGEREKVGGIYWVECFSPLGKGHQLCVDCQILAFKSCSYLRFMDFNIIENCFDFLVLSFLFSSRLVHMLSSLSILFYCPAPVSEARRLWMHGAPTATEFLSGHHSSEFDSSPTHPTIPQNKFFSNCFGGHLYLI